MSHANIHRVRWGPVGSMTRNMKAFRVIGCSYTQVLSDNCLALIRSRMWRLALKGENSPHFQSGNVLFSQSHRPLTCVRENVHSNATPLTTKSTKLSNSASDRKRGDKAGGSSLRRFPPCKTRDMEVAGPHAQKLVKKDRNLPPLPVGFRYLSVDLSMREERNGGIMW